MYRWQDFTERVAGNDTGCLPLSSTLPPFSVLAKSIDVDARSYSGHCLRRQTLTLADTLVNMTGIVILNSSLPAL